MTQSQEKSSTSTIGLVGRKAEARFAQRNGGRQTIGSGNMDGDKGDVVFSDMLVECKATEAESYSIPLQVLAKISREALRVGKHPALSVQFVLGNGKPQRFGSWVMIPEELAVEVLGWAK